MRRWLVALLVTGSLLLTACGGGGASDSGAFNVPGKLPAGPQTGATVTVDTKPGPAIKDVAIQGGEAPLSWLVEFPELRSTTLAAVVINRSLRATENAEIVSWKAATGDTAASLMCQSDVLLDTVTLLSLRTYCSSGHAPVATLTATYAQSSGALLTLGDLFSGTYLQTLSTDAMTQLTVNGTATAAEAAKLAAPTAAAFGAWALDMSNLDVTFSLPAPVGPVTVSFPLDNLAAFVGSSGLLIR